MFIFFTIAFPRALFAFLLARIASLLRHAPATIAQRCAQPEGSTTEHFIRVPVAEAAAMAPSRANWAGSRATDKLIARQRQFRRIPLELLVAFHAPPAGEVEPRPDAGEVVIVGSHLG